ncbi:hypothetical protein ACH5RR_034927 [Cinchona calisaya]|uniref:Uncharacterized protein n=1 Tax=Cinchona calisaya TaxID=153742 RepID=A0ABD2YCC8_9GENT
MKTGLEKSGVNFLWVVRKNDLDLIDGFENKVEDKGLVVKEWIDQRQILEHNCSGISQSLWMELCDGKCMCKSSYIGMADVGLATAECKDGGVGNQDWNNGEEL